jgi:hypothetical protein
MRAYRHAGIAILSFVVARLAFYPRRPIAHDIPVEPF